MERELKNKSFRFSGSEKKRQETVITPYLWAGHTALICVRSLIIPRIQNEFVNIALWRPSKNVCKLCSSVAEMTSFNRKHIFFSSCPLLLAMFLVMLLPASWKGLCLFLFRSHLWTVSVVQHELPLWKANRLFHMSVLPLQHCIGG